jgi:hypothetical protein
MNTESLVPSIAELKSIIENAMTDNQKETLAAISALCINAAANNLNFINYNQELDDRIIGYLRKHGYNIISDFNGGERTYKIGGW